MSAEIGVVLCIALELIDTSVEILTQAGFDRATPSFVHTALHTVDLFPYVLRLG